MKIGAPGRLEPGQRNAVAMQKRFEFVVDIPAVVAVRVHEALDEIALGDIVIAGDRDKGGGQPIEKVASAGKL